MFLTFEDCLGLCELNEQEVLAIAEHEHIPAIAAVELGNYLVHTAPGEQRIKAMIRDDIARAAASGDRLQDEFVHEWLFYRSGRKARAQLATYESSGLATGEVNVRFDRLGRLARTPPDWTYCSAAFEPAVLTWLGNRWSLDYRPPAVGVRRRDGSGVIEPNAEHFERDTRKHGRHADELLGR